MNAPTSSRAFTLLEVMLAAALGAMVVLASVGMFAALDREQARQKVVVRETTELSRTQEAMEKSMRILILNEKGPAAPLSGAAGQAAAGSSSASGNASGVPSADPSKSGSATGTPSSGSGSSTGNDATGRSTTGGTTGSGSSSSSTSDTTSGVTTINPLGTSTERPRFLLEPDTGQLATMPYRGRQVAPQRLELAILAPPAFAKPPEGLSLALAQRRARRSGGSSSSSSSSTSASSSSRSSTTNPDGSNTNVSTPAATWRIAEGVRGAFELVPEVPTKNQDKPSWSLVWRTISSAMTADVPDPTAAARASDSATDGASGRRESSVANPALSATDPTEEPLDLGRAVLATGLTSCHWEAYRDRKFQDVYGVADREKLPAYLRMSVETLAGNSMEWIFEVAWVIGPEPGTIVSTAAAAGGVAGTTAAGQPATGTTGTTGQPATGTPTTPTPTTVTPATPLTRPGRPITPPTGTAPSQPRPPQTGQPAPAMPAAPEPPPPPKGASPKVAS